VRREVKRVGLARFLDVLAFRIYYSLNVASKDQRWQQQKVAELKEIYSPVNVPTLLTHSPNSPEAEEFILNNTPDIMIARCKTLLKESVFSIPAVGTFVMHPGICPEYRNAHGCFWALANNDSERVGMTLLRIDKGVDTGPVYGYYSYPYDEVTESHIVIQHRVVLENLAQLETKFGEIYRGEALPLQVSGRSSRTWGQPWLSKYWAWKKRARELSR
jgi:methionyl-tRNA formyltransferase